MFNSYDITQKHDDFIHEDQEIRKEMDPKTQKIVKEYTFKLGLSTENPGKHTTYAAKLKSNFNNVNKLQDYVTKFFQYAKKVPSLSEEFVNMALMYEIASKKDTQYHVFKGLDEEQIENIFKDVDGLIEYINLSPATDENKINTIKRMIGFLNYKKDRNNTPEMSLALEKQIETLMLLKKTLECKLVINSNVKEQLFNIRDNIKSLKMDKTNLNDSDSPKILKKGQIDLYNFHSLISLIDTLKEKFKPEDFEKMSTDQKNYLIECFSIIKDDIINKIDRFHGSFEFSEETNEYLEELKGSINKNY